MKVTAIMPMKGHSERVPNKNLRAFAGMPLYHCMMQVLEELPLVEKVLINTDSLAIADDATRHFSKAVIIERPKELLGDHVPMNDIIAHDIEAFASDVYLQTHSTNPMLTAATLREAALCYDSVRPGSDSLFSVTKIQSRLYWNDGKAINHNPDELLRTQDLPPVYEENSNFYFFTRDSFLGNGRKRIGRNPKMFAISKIEAVDIDEPEDFTIAELLFMKLRKNGGR